MTVEILRLSGLDTVQATEAANELLSDRGKHPVLRRTLVVDDAVALADHAETYQRLLTSRRLERLLSVAVGPRGPEGPAGQRPRIRIPPNISSRQGSAVLWVGDPRGIDWRLSARAIADGHRGSSASGLDYLLEVLSVEEVYDAVLRTMVEHVPNGVASPGLKLAGADDAAASFDAALVLAIQRLTGPDSGLAADAEAPFAMPQPGQSPAVGLTEGGELARYHGRIVTSASAISEALAKPRGRLLRKSNPDVRDDVIATGQDLRAFRDRVARLFTAAQSAGELTSAQRDLVIAAGISLPDPAAAEDGRSKVFQTVAEAIRGGDTLPRVIRRLTLSGRQLKHRGSASYLAEVEKTCPSGLLGRLASPPQRPSGKAETQAWQQALGLADTARAADGLAALVVTVARREWSGNATAADAVTRARITLDGISERLAGHAAQAGTADVSGARAARLARLSDSLMPILCDLVDKVLTAESAAPSPAGQEALKRAHEKTGALLTEWLRYTAENGPLAQPSFATSAVYDHTYVDDDIAAIREALLHDPRQEMWQLCEPDDISALDVAKAPRVVAFAPQPTKTALGEVLPQDMKWTTSGSHAGLIRLVPLRSSATWVEWANGDGLAEADDAPAGNPTEPLL
jgi:hypothetical protein